MKQLYLLPILICITIATQAQLNSKNQWFWNTSLSTHIESASGFLGSEHFRTNLFGQFRVGQERVLSEKWSFLQSYGLRFGYNQYRRDIEEINFAFDQRRVNVRLDINWFIWNVRTEVPIYWRYRLNEKLSLTGGGFAALSFFNFSIIETNVVSIDPLDDINQNRTTNNFNWWLQGTVGLELGIVRKLNERVDLRFNVQQSVMDVMRLRRFNDEDSYFQLSPFRPAFSSGVNVKFQKSVN
ncbi:MAG: hypothetical protein AAGI23_00965 [Bacteroidota bacterium]